MHKLSATLRAAVNLIVQRSQSVVVLAFIAGTSLPLIASFFSERVGESNAERLWLLGICILVFSGTAWFVSRRDIDLADGHPTSIRRKPDGSLEVTGDARSLRPKHVDALLGQISGVVAAKPPIPVGIVDESMKPISGSEDAGRVQGQIAKDQADKNRAVLFNGSVPVGLDYDDAIDAVNIESLDPSLADALIASKSLMPTTNDRQDNLHQDET